MSSPWRVKVQCKTWVRIRRKSTDFSLSAGFHYEHNDWLSRLEGDERNGANENVYQGELLLIYRMSEQARGYTGAQYSTRKESFEAEGITNTNVGEGMQATF
jgi:hypothetical protein